MTYRTNIQWIDGGRILAECGPMRLVIEAWVGRIPQKELCLRAAKEAFVFLEKIAKHRSLLSIRHKQLPDTLDDFLALEMIRSVIAIDEELTPMAAVAGTIADGVADFLFSRGMTRVIVNNGGDVAIRIGSDESVKIGIRPDLAQSTITEIITLGNERESWGIATSGLEGRSMTCGVASAATIIAKRASVADAAATSIANASYIKDDSVIQKPAEELDEQTDIPGAAVTVQAGPFSDKKKDLALTGAIKKANLFIEKGLIDGAYVAVDGRVLMTDFMRRKMNQPSD